MKPLIAITTRITSNHDKKQFSVNAEYVQSIIDAGGVPWLLLSDQYEDLKIQLSLCQGLLVTGGVDINPTLYHQPNTASYEVDDYQDRHDLNSIKIAYELGLPILGVCRGCQILNVYAKGTLTQDIETAYPKIKAETHRDAALNKDYHLINVQSETLRHLLKDEIQVNSYHHQVVDQLGEGLKVAAISDDGLIEAIEGPNMLAVQWHPERMPEHLSVFTWLINKSLALKHE